MRWQWWGRGKRFAVFGLLCTALMVWMCARVSIVRADTLRVRGDWEVTTTDSRVTNTATGERIESKFTRTVQQYNLDVTKNIFPTLTLLGGAFYELTDLDTTTDGQDSQSEETFLRPFVRLDLNTPLYAAGAEFRHSRIENDFGEDFRTVAKRDDLNTFFGYRPVGLPEFTVRYDQNRSYNEAGTRDTLEKTLQLESTYNPIDTLRLSYFYQRDQNEERIRNSKIVNQRHNGRIDYSRQFIDNRVTMNTGYQIDYNLQELPAQAIVDTEITPTAGLFSIDDTPEDGPALAPNNALIDGLVNVSAGIDIGLGGDETTLTNIGLDLGLPTDINRILLWVEQRLTPAVANSFIWDIYVSPDNLDTSTWIPVATVSPAPFGIFENRFEITFPTVRTRFIKVVTRPLSPIVPGSGSFPNIFVTEMEPFLTISDVPVTTDLESLDHNYNLTLTGRLSSRTVLGYDLFYRVREQDLAVVAGTDKRSEISNGLFLRHTFNPVFSTNARVLRSDTDVNDLRIIDYSYSASLRAQYIETFNQNLVFSGTRSELEDGAASTYSIFLRNNAVLYRNWSAFLDFGHSWSNTLFFGEETTNEVRFGTNAQPHRTLTLTLDGRWLSTDPKSPEFADSSEINYNLQAFFVPYPTISLFGKISVRDREDRRSTVQNYTLNWSPFPDGALQFTFLYNETLRPEIDGRDVNFGPAINWTISRHLFLESQYSISTSDTQTQEVETSTLRAEIRFIW